MSRFRVRLLIFVLLVSIPSPAVGWDYVPYKGNNLGYLSGGTLGTLHNQHPNETNNIFSLDGSGDEELYFDDDENHSFGGVLVKVQNVNGGCTWYEYQGAAKFGEEYVLGSPLSVHDGDCDKP